MSGFTGQGVDPSVKQAISDLSTQFQRVAHKHFDREPFANEVPEKGFVLATVSGTSYIYTKIDGARFKVALTAV